MARRGINIYKRKDGRWEGRYIKGRRVDGALIYGYIYARKYNECKEKLMQAKASHMYVQEAVKICGTGLVSDFISYWLCSIVQPYVKTSTFSNYVSVVNRWICPCLGKKKLICLSREDIQHFISHLSEHGLSAGTVHNIYRVLNCAMKKAKEYVYLYGNPCEGVRLPKKRKKEARLLTLSEQKRLEQAAKGDKNGLAIFLAIYTGLRVGEICALRWSDVDLEKEVMHISLTTQRIQCHVSGNGKKTVLVTGSAKSGCSVRSIPLPACITDMLKEYQKKSSSEFVFVCRGHSLEPRILQYRFKALLKRAGLEDLNFHGLRHTFATRCMELGIDVKTLSEMLGHASAKMTLDRYGHSQMEHKRESMKILNRLFA